MSGTVFIVNPAAGFGRAARRWEKLAPELRRRTGDFETWATDAPGAGATLARRALERGFDTIVAVGGDGTLREMVDGLASAPAELRARAVAGTWPAGSGCDAARHLGLSPKDPVEKLAGMLRARRVRPIDVGRIRFAGADGRERQTHFVNIAALGMAGEAARRVERSGKRWGGSLSYLITSLEVLATATLEPVQLTVDGEQWPTAELPLVAIANASCFGGGMRVAAGADMTDGYFDLVTIQGWSRWQLLRHFPKVYVGKPIQVAGFDRRKARRIEARAAEGKEVWLNVDGEALGRLPAVFEVVPGAVPFLFPG